MATTNNTIELQAALDKAKSVKNINKDIEKIKGQIKPLELQVKPDAKSLQSLDGMKKDLEKLSKDISSKVSEIMSGDISSQISGELKKAENATDSSLSSMLDIWSSFGDAVEKIFKSDNIISGFNSLLSLISTLNNSTKGALGSLGTVGLGAGLFGINYFIKNFA
ncbi:MAG: hypothetical protein HDR08_10515 [Lachnospiraceae bacterium]|nr:hypothetical protein [Lachnospiraceae bacterium]